MQTGVTRWAWDWCVGAGQTRLVAGITLPGQIVAKISGVTYSGTGSWVPESLTTTETSWPAGTSATGTDTVITSIISRIFKVPVRTCGGTGVVKEVKRIKTGKTSGGVDTVWTGGFADFTVLIVCACIYIVVPWRTVEQAGAIECKMIVNSAVGDAVVAKHVIGLSAQLAKLCVQTLQAVVGAFVYFYVQFHHFYLLWKHYF